MFADYYVMTDDPWRLAKLALVAQFNDKWKERALDAADVDGESDYTISAVIYNPLDDEPDEESGSYCDAWGAWLVIDIFPEDEPREGRPVYDSIESAFDSADLSLVVKES